MKVICIKEPRNCSKPEIIVGNFYNVIDCVYLKENEVIYDTRVFGGIHYELKEVPDFLFHASCFSIVSSIDETEMIREYNKELV